MKRFLNLIGALAAAQMSAIYLADNVSVDTANGLLLTTAFVVLLCLPAANAATWWWRRDVLPWIRRKTMKGGKTPKKR